MAADFKKSAAFFINSNFSLNATRKALFIRHCSFLIISREKKDFDGLRIAPHLNVQCLASVRALRCKPLYDVHNWCLKELALVRLSS